MRWIALLGMTLALAIRAPLPLPVAVVLSLALVWNILVTLLAARNKRLPYHALLSTGVDFIIAMLLFAFSGGALSHVTWSGVLPLITATLYYRAAGMLALTLVNLLSQAGYTLSKVNEGSWLVLTAYLLPLYLLVGLVVLRLYRPPKKKFPVVEKPVPAASNIPTGPSEPERRQAVFKLITALSATLNYQRVLETALDLSASALYTPESPTDKLVSAVLMFQPSSNGVSQLAVASARRLTSSDQRLNLPGTSGLLGRAIDGGLSAHTADIARDPELNRMIALQTCQAAYCIPLRTGLDICGVMLFAHTDADYFNTDRRDILDIIGNQVTIAIQNASLYQDLEAEKEHIIEIQEEAQTKLARDLHDGPTQSVSAIAMRVNFARRLMERDQKAAAAELFKIEEMARQTVREIRHMLFTLRPLVLESQGLVPALETMAERMRDTYQQNVIVQADPRLATLLEANKQAVVFSIVDEAVNNARKHAKATHIWVRLRAIKDDLALLEIQDDGAGFNVEAVNASYENRGSLGMVNMRERAELINGLLHIESAPGRGTSIQMVIPLTDAAADRLRIGR